MKQRLKKSLEEKHLGGFGAGCLRNRTKNKQGTFQNRFPEHGKCLSDAAHLVALPLKAQEKHGVDGASKLISYLETVRLFGSLTIPALNLPVQEDAHRMLHLPKRSLVYWRNQRD